MTILIQYEGSRVRQKGSRLRQETPEEGRRVHRPKRCICNNKNEDNSSNTLDNINYQASFK